MITAIIRWSEFYDTKLIKNDPSWYDNPLSIWNVVEPSIYLMSGCLLSYRVLFRTVAESNFASSAYRFLNRRRSYTSFDKQPTGSRGNQLAGFGRSGFPLKDSTVLPFPKIASNGEAMAMGTPRDGTIHGKQEFDVRI